MFGMKGFYVSAKGGIQGHHGPIDIISNTDKHEFSSTCKCISCYNDVMNHLDCVIMHENAFIFYKCPW